MTMKIDQAAHRDPDATLFWHPDDQFLGITEVFHGRPGEPRPYDARPRAVRGPDVETLWGDAVRRPYGLR